MKPAAVCMDPNTGPEVRSRFDRGTFVLEGRGVRLDELALPGVAWDDRVGLHRMPAYLAPALERALVSQSIRSRPEGRAVGPVVRTWKPVELRPYQEAALRAWWLAGRRGTVVLPTGAGKTRLAVAAMAHARVRALCLVPTRVLLHQWAEVIRQHYSGPIGVLGDGVQQPQAITVATFESAYLQMARLGDRFDLLIVDEAHHFGRGVRDEALEMCAAPARLGLTATPATAPSRETQTDSDGAEPDRLAELVGPLVFELAIGDLAGTFLAPFEIVAVRLDLDGDERRRYEEDRRAFQVVQRRLAEIMPGANWSEFARAAATTKEGKAALAAWRRAQALVAFNAAKGAAVERLLARHREARVLLFTADNAATYAVARRHLIMPITCDIKREERDAALSLFRRGELRALVSARVLNEGVDVPDADVAIIVAGTMGQREHVQRIGRLLRPVPGKRAVVYELITRGTHEEHQAQKRRMGLEARDTRGLHRAG